MFGPHPFDEERWFQDVKTGSARATAAPINREGEVLHLGASWRSRDGATEPRSTTAAAPFNTDQFFAYGARGADLHLEVHATTGQGPNPYSNPIAAENVIVIETFATVLKKEPAP